MAGTLNNAIVIIQPYDIYAGYSTAPVCWPVVASDMNMDPGTSVDGRYVEAKGKNIEGLVIPKMQPTTLVSGLNTGRTFNVVSGNWHDDWLDPASNQNGLLMPNSSASTNFEITSATTTTNIEQVEIWLRRGDPPPADSAARSATGYNCYIEFANGSIDGTNYRVAIEWGQPFRLDYSDDKGASWKPVATLRDVASTDVYCSAHANLIKLRVQVNHTTSSIGDTISNQIAVEVGNVGWLLAVSPKGILPSPGSIRLSGINGSVNFNYFPLRAQPITVTGTIDTGQTQDNGGAAFLQNNELGRVPPSQTEDQSVSTSDNQKFDYTQTAQTDDAGDGLGGLDTPILANVTLVIPAVWYASIDGIPDPIGKIQLANRTVDELLVWDDATRTFVSSALIDCDNQYGTYANAYGHRHCTINASVGGSYVQRFNGIAGESVEGIDLVTYENGFARMRLPCRGHEAKMQVNQSQRRIYDGWALPSAVRFEAELGNVNPNIFMNNVPLYIPPGGTQQAPYGEAGDDCPYFILGKGSGTSPRYEFGSEFSPWAALQSLCQSQGYIDPTTGNSLPFYMGFTADGQFHFEYYDPGLQTPIMFYSTKDNTINGVGASQIYGEIHSYNSVAQMRTDIDFQGLDSWTYELLVAHLTMPNAVKKAIGYRYPWLERDAKYDVGYIQNMINVAGAVASQKQQVVKFQVPFSPQVFPGQVCYVSEPKSVGGTNKFVIIEMRSRYGMQSSLGGSGIRDNYSMITARSLQEYPRTGFSPTSFPL